MAIREWWADDAAERYWMEATDRATLGEDLRAPLTGQEGRGVWHYSLVSYTRPGDIVFHWHTTLYDRPAIVGWSTVLGPLREEEHEWTPHAGQLTTPAGARPNWVVPLGGIHYLDEPISLADIEASRSRVLGIRDDVESVHGTPTYFPFNGYGANGIRAAQAYLTKMPHALVELLSSLHGVELGTEDDPGIEMTPSATDMRSGGQGFLRDTARKLAIEQHAIGMAVEHYRTLGATEVEILGKPYDIRLRLDGEEVHVEVKGSGNGVAEVLVTRNEVHHARTFARTELVVVDGIDWQREEAGEITTVGGRLRRWPSWSPSDASLTPMTYVHALLEDGR
ncbi:protein NO VEIN domain-containing protein [Microbacterium oleivorans]|uniref:DUF3883 domain-containing protein n=1 Tax=Microbacterium oleivorans TaxID=273677 RepID=A0A4R5YIZ5_9MICO|nr:DUF3883 domain-containing protein [Microbacterium oleivorans]TDL45116.1 DUF3883 domain-containing protein [Microbacterium oleivorans]